MRKTQLNFLPSLMYGMIDAESCASSDIAKCLNEEKKWAQYESIVKRINRFWNNKHFNGKEFFNKAISSVIDQYKLKHSDNKIHISFDHMFSHDNYTVLMFTLRVGTQGIPIYFECFKGSNNNDTFEFESIKKGIDAVDELFKDKGFKLIFLADRWFDSTQIFDYIDKLGHTYCIRLKGNIVAYKDNKKIIVKKLKHRKYHAVVHNDVYITHKRFKTNIVYSSSIDTSTPWIIATNDDVLHAVQNYSHRFGSIESVFKNQKSNGFNLNKISNMSLRTFTNMYSVLCICVVYLTILGTDFSKNSKCYKDVCINTHKNYNINGKKVKRRIMSLFNTGLTLFKIAHNSLKYIRLPFSFKLYDI